MFISLLNRGRNFD